MTSIQRLFPGVPALAAALLLAACSGGGAASDAAPTPDVPQAGADGPALPEGHPPIQGAPGGTMGHALMTGTVLETMDAGGYTYARLRIDDGDVWTAGPLTALEEGETVSLADPMEMTGFTSATLDRTFESIYFTSGYVKAGATSVTPRGTPQARVDGAVGKSRATVRQAIPASGYVYLEVEDDSGMRWLAGPATDVEAGDVVAWSGGSLMQNFPSRTLDRTFPEILFVDRVDVVPAS